jgi:hypothetical protein
LPCGRWYIVLKVAIIGASLKYDSTFWQTISLSCPVCKGKIESHSSSRVLDQVCEKIRQIEIRLNFEELSKPGAATNDDDSISNSETEITSEVVGDFNVPRATCCWIIEGKIVY